MAHQATSIDVIAHPGRPGQPWQRTLMTAVHEVHAAELLTVAIGYGAYRVPAITHGRRDRYGYFVRDAAWLTVFTL